MLTTYRLWTRTRQTTPKWWCDCLKFTRTLLHFRHVLTKICWPNAKPGKVSEEAVDAVKSKIWWAFRFSRRRGMSHEKSFVYVSEVLAGFIITRAVIMLEAANISVWNFYQTTREALVDRNRQTTLLQCAHSSPKHCLNIAPELVKQHSISLSVEQLFLTTERNEVSEGWRKREPLCLGYAGGGLPRHQHQSLDKTENMIWNSSL